MGAFLLLSLDGRGLRACPVPRYGVRVSPSWNTPANAKSPVLRGTGLSVVPPYFTAGALRLPYLLRALAYRRMPWAVVTAPIPSNPTASLGPRTGGSQVHSVSASGAGSHLTRLSWPRPETYYSCVNLSGGNKTFSTTSELDCKSCQLSGRVYPIGTQLAKPRKCLVQDPNRPLPVPLHRVTSQVTKASSAAPPRQHRHRRQRRYRQVPCQSTSFIHPVYPPLRDIEQSPRQGLKSRYYPLASPR